MDTDGTVYKGGGTAYTSNSIQLARDVQELVWSLGGIATISKMCNAYRCNISLNLNIFRLPRKVEREHTKHLNRLPIISIEKIDTVASQCLMVDTPEKTFLVNDYVITHNSTLKEYLILYLAVFGELPGLGKVPYALYVSDSIENGVKKMRKSLEFRHNNV
jgi:hypothetical protein